MKTRSVSPCEHPGCLPDLCLLPPSRLSPKYQAVWTRAISAAMMGDTYGDELIKEAEYATGYAARNDDSSAGYVARLPYALREMKEAQA